MSNTLRNTGTAIGVGLGVLTGCASGEGSPTPAPTECMSFQEVFSGDIDIVNGVKLEQITDFSDQLIEAANEDPDNIVRVSRWTHPSGDEPNQVIHLVPSGVDGLFVLDPNLDYENCTTNEDVITMERVAFRMEEEEIDILLGQIGDDVRSTLPTGDVMIVDAYRSVDLMTGTGDNPTERQDIYGLTFVSSEDVTVVLGRYHKMEGDLGVTEYYEPVVIAQN